ncbi:MAG: FG-GAP repeat protein, partial [Methanoregula sp.]|nr:FG-GAP repeat protein [Methanoregula sp.]
MAVILTLILCIAPGAGASIALPAVADPGLITVPDPLPGSPDSPLAFRYDAATGTWQGQNTVQRTDIAVTTDGLVLLASPNGTAVLRLAGIGRESLADFPAGTIRADGDRLEIGRGTATEWYVNHETGIEQEMTLGARPSGTGDLQIAFDLSGDLRPALLAGQVLLLSDGHGPVLTYGGLVATDAGGNVLPSEMVLDGTRLFWQVDDRDAVYPVSIDPVIAPASSAKVQFTGGAADDEFGISVALSSDGSTALIGADYNSTAGDYAGAAYVFEKKDGTWESGATARFTGSAADDVFGYSVALSSDGSTALIGAVDNSTAGDYAGAAYVFEKGAGWESASASAATARFTGGAKNDSFGWSVALSSDGSMALIGAPGNDTAGSNAGAAYVFEKGAGWESASASAAMARFTGGAADDVFGYSVALSSDGSTALIGAWYNSTAGSNAGAAYIFEKDGVWKDASASAATARFTGGAADDVFGYSVALSSDGSTALIGAVDNSTAGDYAGAAYVFEKGAGWVSAPASAATA